MQQHKWMEPVIRVNKIYEDEQKGKLRNINSEIDMAEKKLQDARNTLAVEEKRLIVNILISPVFLEQAFAYTTEIQRKICALEGELEGLYTRKLLLQNGLKEKAGKRILLENLQQKYKQRETKNILQQEQLVLEETDRYQNWGEAL